jgi:hypothetical protein
MRGRPPPPKSPEEKKAHSYANDRRNSYGQNGKASRKAIPRRKAGESRQNRRKVNQALSGIPELDETAAALVESSARQDLNRVGGWKKVPDISLSDHIDLQSRRRSKRESRRAAKKAEDSHKMICSYRAYKPRQQ